MIKYVEITVDSVTYLLAKGNDDLWRVTNRAPTEIGEYPVTVTITTGVGGTFTIDYDDPALEEVLKLLVIEGKTESGNRMLDYYPYVIKIIREFQALMLAEGFEVDFIQSELEAILADAFLSTMGAKRIEEWEHALGLSHDNDDSLDDRRENIIARMRSSGKLNTERINRIVNIYTGMDAESYFKDSTIYVKINAPAGNKQYKFDNLEQILNEKKPAHLNIVVTRNYATWNEVKSDFASWQALHDWTINGTAAAWDDVKFYVSP